MRSYQFALLSLLTLTACTLQRASDALHRRVESFASELLERQRSVASGSPMLVALQVTKNDLADIRKGIDLMKATSDATLLGRRLQLTREMLDDFASELTRRSKLLQQIDRLSARYEEQASAAAFVSKLVEERSRLENPAQLGADLVKNVERWESATQTQTNSLVVVLTRLREANAATERVLVDATAMKLPHVAELHTQLEARIQALLPVTKLRVAAANAEQRSTLAAAQELLEGVAPSLRNGDGSPYLDPATVQRVAKIVDEAEQKIAEAEQKVELRPNPWFRMHVGFATLSPYVVRESDPNNSEDPPGSAFVLDEASTKPVFYVEADFLHRWAWLRDEERTEPAAAGVLGDLKWLAPTEHEIRLRFTDVNDIKDAKSAASGDWSAEASVGWSMFEYEVADAASRSRLNPRGSMTLETNAGFSTDRGSNDVHGFIQGGLGSAWSFPIEMRKGVYMPATFFGGIYYGLHSFPRLEENDTSYTTRKRPYFNDLGALGVKIDVVYPLSESVEFVVGGRLAGRFDNDAPENWALFVGISLPIGKLFGGTQVPPSTN